MPIMVIVGRGKRKTLDITGWSKQEVEGVMLSVEIDGYQAHTGVGR